MGFLLRMPYSPEMVSVISSLVATCIQAKGVLPSLFYASDFAQYFSSYLDKCDPTKTGDIIALCQSQSCSPVDNRGCLSEQALRTACTFLQGDDSINEEAFGQAMEELLNNLKPEQFSVIETLYPLFEAIFRTKRYAQLAAVLFRSHGDAPLLAEKLLSCLHSLLFFQFPSFEVGVFTLSLILDVHWR